MVIRLSRLPFMDVPHAIGHQSYQPHAAIPGPYPIQAALQHPAGNGHSPSRRGEVYRNRYDSASEMSRPEGAFGREGINSAGFLRS